MNKFQKLLLKIKINSLKRKAKHHYLAHLYYSEEYSCGNNLAQHMSTTLSYHKTEFNKIADKLALLDKSTPKSRL
jgi:hypothetical protein